MYTETFQGSPEKTPASIRWILLLMLASSMFWIICSKIFPLFSFSYLLPVFSLSQSALAKGYLWQLITYPFTQPVLGSVSFNYLIDLGFKLYITWVFGSSLAQSRGETSFLRLFFSGIIVTGLLTACAMYLTGSFVPLMGAHSALYTILIAWMLLNPYAKIYVFFTIPLSVTLAILSVWGINLFLSLLDGHMTHFVAYLVAGVYGYMYAIRYYQGRSPFRYLRSFECFLQDFQWKRVKRKKGAVYDFKTGKPISEEEAFMDAMLEKIATKGKESLTKEEIKKMDEISKKRS